MAKEAVPIPSLCPMTGRRDACWGKECHRWRPGDLCSHPLADDPGTVMHQRQGGRLASLMVWWRGGDRKGRDEGEDRGGKEQDRAAAAAEVAAAAADGFFDGF